MRLHLLEALADLRKKTPLSILKRRNISQSSIHAGFKRFLPFKNVTRSFTRPPKNVTRCFLTLGLPLRRERSSSPDQSVICNASALRGYRRIKNGHQKKTKTLNTKKPHLTMLGRAGRKKAPDMPGRWKVEGSTDTEPGHLADPRGGLWFCMGEVGFEPCAGITHAKETRILAAIGRDYNFRVDGHSEFS